MPKLIIDGQTVEVEEGKTLLDAAKDLNIEIPTLCHHWAVPEAGACRICVVEIKAGGRPGLVPACAYPAQDGLEIETYSERVVKSRRMTLALMRSRAPKAKVIQEMAEQYQLPPMTLKPSPHSTSDESAPEDTLEACDNELCIMCGLCVRVCREVIGPEATCFSGRGIEREIATPYKLLSDVCIGCGACVASCPNASAMLFTSAKISHLALLPQGRPEAARRAIKMLSTMDEMGFGNCSNERECEAECPKEISITNIARMNREFIKAALGSEE